MSSTRETQRRNWRHTALALPLILALALMHLSVFNSSADARSKKPRPIATTTTAPSPSPSPTPTVTTSPTPTETSTTGAPTVRVSGNKIVNGSGQVIRLLGVNRSGTEFACAQGWGLFDGPSDDASIATMKTWKINTVRVPLNEHCWLGINGANPAYSGQVYRDAVVSWVNRLNRAGLIVVLDLHWNAPGSTLALGQKVMADLDHSPAFWGSVATTFKSNPSVIFDLYNEPHSISWTCWRDGCTTADGWRAAGMQTLINAVRNTGATQPVMIAGTNWAGDLSQWLAFRPTDPAGQMIASAHIYNFSQCNTVACWDASIGQVAAQFPVVTGELGQDNCSGDFINTYMNWADSKGISYLGWTWNTWNCSTGPALISSYDGTPTAFGLAFRNRLQQLQQ
jgi:endoglucanase